ncbi:MAG: hypothetical protein A2474_00890 [Elusimicrobia bacterium RIFOXYC2_FULL_34_12]|nr:MAG: hypothetical protein A2474_00890 [Elusimicrobia bacterium RIFOXYC2_FULL_34_12]OGS38878.1 MAG: hypothetical protein A2551_03380 [Elusimicrobia bacterium RIFOXYD2_FULL_34_30]HAM39050.1 glycosyl transferase [Elusimicrobiota bacterium]
MKQLTILHIDFEKTWRGGQQQLFWLVEGLSKKGYRNFIICQPNSELHKRLKENDYNTIGFKILFEIDPFAIFKTKRIIEDIKPDIIHLHSAHAHTIGLIASMLSDQKTKLVCTRRVEFNINNKWKYGSVDKIIAISNKVKEVLVKDGIPENRISVVFSGIDLNRFENISTDYLYKEFNVKEGNTIIGTVGSLDYHKNHKGFIQAASLIKKSIPDAVFFIVGKGCLEKELKEYAKKLNLSDSIIFTGFRNDIPQILSIFDIFVLSSYTEGLCTSLIDAMAVGLPIIATNVGGVPELIAENINGFQVLPDNPAQIYEAVMKLVKDRNLLNRFSELNKIKAKEFSKDRMIENTEHVYWEMI